MSRIFTTSVASVYPHYVTKVERKGRTQDELHEVIAWLTGYDEAALQAHLAAGTTFEDFFAAADLNPLASSITGSVCGVRVQDVEDPLMRQIRYLDKLVDELAKADPAITARVAAGRLKIVGAFYDESNGQITLHAESGAGADMDAAQIVDVPTE